MNFWFNVFLWISYYAVGSFYVFSGLFLAYKAHLIEGRLPRWFPLLHSFKLKRAHNVVNLVIMGLVLLIVATGLQVGAQWGIHAAVFFSVWEILLAFTFYLWIKDFFQAGIHLVIHALLVAGIFFFLLR